MPRNRMETEALQQDLQNFTDKHCETVKSYPPAIIEKIEQELLPVWQPVSAIAFRCEIPVRSCLTALNGMYYRGMVHRVRVRLDGHNRVWCYKTFDVVNVLGVSTVVEPECGAWGERSLE